MDYKKYIDLGFERSEMNCSVEFEKTGYSGFALEKKVSDKISVCVSSGDLDKPKLYINKKQDQSSCHIMPISCEAVIDLFSK
jgi:hypothetical protein